MRMLKIKTSLKTNEIYFITMLVIILSIGVSLAYTLITLDYEEKENRKSFCESYNLTYHKNTAGGLGEYCLNNESAFELKFIGNITSGNLRLIGWLHER